MKSGATRQFYSTTEFHHEHGKHPNSHTNNIKIPKWVTCDAREFERMLKAGELTPCSDAEWQRIKGMFHSGNS